MIENQGKPNQKIVTIYDDIYDLPDCRSYYRAMRHAGFRTAHHATAAFRTILQDLKRLRGLNTVNVVDFASGYGIASALMRHDVTLEEVLERYEDPWFDDAKVDDAINADRDWYSNLRAAGQSDRYAGIDIAGNAMAYGKAVGIYDEAFAENLQEDAPGPALSEFLQSCDLIVECGSVAHMLPDALDRILVTALRKPWIATAPIRGNDSARALEVMQDHGLQVEVLDMPPFRHRRFANDDEQKRAIENAKARGHETNGYESMGYFHAQVYLARPETA